MNYKKPRVFNSEQLPAYRAAVEALRALPIDDARRTAAEVVWAEYLRMWKEDHGVHEAHRGHACLTRLVTRRRCSYVAYETERGAQCLGFPGGDHVEAWTRDGEVVAVTSQPYSLNLEQVEELVALCKAHALELSITPGSWHFPGGTMLVVVGRKDWTKLAPSMQAPAAPPRTPMSREAMLAAALKLLE